MGYKKAEVILPAHLLRAIQEYVDGECLYIPRRQEKRKAWGESAQGRQHSRAREARNLEIAAKRLAGLPVASLAEQYFLSDKAIYKILKAVKNG